jgi:uncharacterized protein
MLDLYLEIDASNVYSDALRAAQRHGLDLYVITRDFLAGDGHVHVVAIQDDQVNGSAWILANISRGDICVTADPRLATKCIQCGAVALSPNGRQWGIDALNNDIEAGNPLPSFRSFGLRLERSIAAARAEPL